MSRRSRAHVLGASAIVIVLGGGLVTATFAEGETVTDSAAGSVALVGSADGVNLDQAEFAVEVWPRADIERKLQIGDRVPTYVLQDGAVSATGATFTVRLDPRKLPAEVVNDNGNVHLDVTVVEPGKQLMGSTSATVSLVNGPEAGAVRWIDPLDPLAENGKTRSLSQTESAQLTPVSRRIAMDAVSESDLRLAQVASTRSAAGGGCTPGYYLTANSDRKAGIARTYVPSGTTSYAWAYHDSTRSHEFGVAANVGQGWKRSGSKSFESGTEFTWAGSRARTRSYRVDTRYGHYRFKNEIYDPGHGYKCVNTPRRKWQPRYDTGGYTSRIWSSNPTWRAHTCKRQSRGTWKRTNRYGEDFSTSTGVLIESLVGFDLSSRRAYSTGSFIAYEIKSPKVLCGNNHVPSKASYIKMKNR